MLAGGGEIVRDARWLQADSDREAGGVINILSQGMTKTIVVKQLEQIPDSLR